MQFTPVKTLDEYKDLVSRLSWLIDAQLKAAEEIAREHPLQYPMGSVPKLISLVNMIGYVRGQDGAFLDIRPNSEGSYQDELYDNENAFEKRLTDFLIAIAPDTQRKEALKFELEQYYIKARLPR